jgi:hypothetical protein
LLLSADLVLQTLKVFSLQFFLEFCRNFNLDLSFFGSQ